MHRAAVITGQPVRNRSGELPAQIYFKNTWPAAQLLSDQATVQGFLEQVFFKENHWYEHKEKNLIWHLYESRGSIVTKYFLKDRRISLNTYELLAPGISAEKITEEMKKLIEQKKQAGFVEIAEKAFYPGVLTIKQATIAPDLYKALQDDDGTTLYHFAPPGVSFINIYPCNYRFPGGFELQDRALFKEHLLLTLFDDKADYWEELRNRE